MKAIWYDKYGPPEQVLKLIELPKPEPKENQVLVSVRAASINSWDLDMVIADSWTTRMWGLFVPRYKVPGADIAGVVEETGKGVTLFRPGDQVYGDLAGTWGGYAEYVAVDQNAIAIKPPEMTFEQAAAIPQAGMLALQSVNKARLISGQTALINGAGGGAGTFAVQIAKSQGAEVTGVDCAEKLGMLRELGADHVIDFQKDDFTRNGKRYDLIIDMVANRSVFAYRNSLNPGGKFYMVGGAMSRIFQVAVFGGMVANEGKTLALFPYQANKGLDEMARLYAAGKVKPVIDKVYPLAQTAAAFRYFAAGNVKGKVVIAI